LRRTPLVSRLQRLQEGYIEEQARSKPQKPTGKRLIQRVGSLVSAGRASASLKARLTQAGFYSPDAAVTFMGSKFGLLLVGLLATATIILPTHASSNLKIGCIAGCAAVLFFLPNVMISHWRAKRAQAIRQHLPDAVDLLEICASAGMGLDIAWNAVADEVRTVNGDLADEMALADLEIHLGASRADALRHMAQRTGAEELSSLVAVLVQSDRFGTSIADALRVFASGMREDRTYRAEEMAEKLAVKLIVPMVMFIFPALILILVGPAGLTIMRIFAMP
jgi:tight adherence protein C